MGVTIYESRYLDAAPIAYSQNTFRFQEQDDHSATILFLNGITATASVWVKRLAIEWSFTLGRSYIEDKLALEEWKTMLRSFSQCFPHLDILLIELHFNELFDWADIGLENLVCFGPVLDSPMPLTLSFDRWDEYSESRELRQINVQAFKQRYIRDILPDPWRVESQVPKMARTQRTEMCRVMLSQIKRVRWSPCELEHRECASSLRYGDHRGACETCKALLEAYHSQVSLS